ncbi:glycoside hydrolase family 97 protein [Sphingosinicella sp. BN140058]|uniref:glycoside hydrolase family 97 protein n=1 Tax=Sphingosinicella sp. BN140058 TaxID=1892855 RepID=UPI001010A9E2|nr:glycoside hydrolase family 97 protein [Sphingosinicella sp. BN140058]QAY76642.1 glycoside hydrolase family 97 protein [Sphingosinicella sp. BN140058]
MKTRIVLAALLTVASSPALAADLRLASPNGRVEIVVGISAQRQPTYAVSFDGKPVIAPSGLGLDLVKGGRLSYGLSVTGSTRQSVDRRYTLFAGKARDVQERFNELSVDLRENDPGAAGRTLRIVFRAYDDGAAFRYVLPVQAQTAGTDIAGEMTRFDFPSDYQCWGLNLGKFGSSHEGEFDPVRASSLREHNLYDAPLVCSTGDGGTSFALAEADLKHYAGMYLQGRGDGGLGAQIKLSPRLDDPLVAVRTRIGSETLSPWRVVMLADAPAKLLQSNLIASLNPDPDFDTAWIKPGKSAWDWWNGPTVAGVKTAGTNDETVKRFIDFAASSGLQYMLIDEGWYMGAGGGGLVRPGVDVTKSIPEINLPELVDYGRKRGVGLWLWLNWKALDAQMDEALALYEKLGIKGIKVDFMDRDDQAMVDWYHRLLRRAADHKLMVNLHGAYHPTGLARTYPHYLTQEGVMGAEYNKWSRRVTARHNVTLAFTRQLLGPMDYTPGGFRNLRPEDFTIQNAPPNVQTTRGHGLAMYVVYESPFSVVADTPDAYRGEAGVDFLSDVPVSWDETRAIAGAIGDYVVVARRKDRDWYVGAMTNESGRDVTLPLDFLGDGKFALTSWTDGEAPTALKVTRTAIGRGARQPLTLRLAPSGGAALRFKAE